MKLNFELIVGVAINEATVDLISLADFFFFSNEATVDHLIFLAEFFFSFFSNDAYIQGLC